MSRRIQIAPFAAIKIVAMPLLTAFLFAACSSGNVWNSDDFSVRIGPDGQISGLVERTTGRDYLADGVPSPLLSLRVGGAIRAPESARINAERNRITLDFSDGLDGKGFHFDNPQAARTCACGESFGM